MGLALRFALPNVQVTGASNALPAAPFSSVNGPQTGPWFTGVTSGAFEGYTVEFSGGTPTIPNPDGGSPMTFQTDRAGFDSSGNTTTYRQTLYVTKKLRQTWPNNASFTANTACISDYIYVSDVLSGATNNSTIVSPKPVANWVTPDRATIGNTITAEIVAGHRNATGGKQVACVIPRVTGKISGVTTTVTYSAVSTPTISGRNQDQFSVIVYAISVDVSAFDDNQELILNAKVYPWVGTSASVLDSGDGTFTARKDFSPRYFDRNTTRAGSPAYVYINSGGNDSTAVVSTTAATAAASPALTYRGAMDKVKAFGDCGGVIVRVGAGGPFALNGTTTTGLTQARGAIIVTRDPGVARASAQVSFGSGNLMTINQGIANTPNTGAIRFTDITMIRAAGLSIKGDATIRLEIQFDDVTMDGGAFSGTWLNQSDDYIYGLTITNNSTNILSAAATGQHRILRGLTVSGPGALEINTMVGCNVTTLTGGFTPSNTLTVDGQLVAFNKVDGISSNGVCIAQTAVTHGFAWLQNLVIWTAGTATGATLAALSNDGKTNNTTNVILHNNTFAGTYAAGRGNNFYDDGTTERFNTLMSCRGNIWAQTNTKGDIFHGANEGNPEGFTSGNPSTRVGNFAYMVGGVGCFDEFSGWASTTATGVNEYGGLGNLLGTSNAIAPTNDPLYVSPSLPVCTLGGSSPTFTAGSTGGNYHLQAGSPCKASMKDAVLPYDLDGNARATSNTSRGAYV